MIEAIFFDIDGTLISFKTKQIPQSTIKSLQLLKEQGIKLFVATGRGNDGLEILKDIPFDGYITLNGQYCFDQNEQMIYQNSIDKGDIKKLVDYVTKHKIACGFTEEHHKRYNFRNELVDELHSITHNDGHPAQDISDVVNKEIFQAQVFVDETKEKEILEFMPNSTSARWFYSFFDVSPKGGTKENGIKKLCEYFNLDRTKCMAFGDGGNDIPMLQCVGTSIAMGNANDEVKQHVDYVTKDVEDDGIYHALVHYGLLNK